LNVFLVMKYLVYDRIVVFSLVVVVVVLYFYDKVN